MQKICPTFHKPYTLQNLITMLELSLSKHVIGRKVIVFVWLSDRTWFVVWKTYGIAW